MARLIFFLIPDGWCVPAIRLARFPGLGVASLDGLQFPPSATASAGTLVDFTRD